jgi:hypothetical protein
MRTTNKWFKTTDGKRAWNHIKKASNALMENFLDTHLHTLPKINSTRYKTPNAAKTALKMENKKSEDTGIQNLHPAVPALSPEGKKTKRKTKFKSHREENYFAIQTPDGRITRYTFNPAREILPLRHPELVDLSFGTRCNAGCPFCYASATANGTMAKNLIEKIKSWFGTLTPNDRPFQAALGGLGDALLHKDFPQALAELAALGIDPNPSTSGLPLLEKTGPERLDAIKQHSRACAISVYEHLGPTWEKATRLLLDNGVQTNLHIIIGQPGSTALLAKTWKVFGTRIANRVILPFKNQGRAISKNINPETELLQTFELINNRKLGQPERFAFGALMENFLDTHLHKFPKINIARYKNPERFSGFIDMTENTCTLRKSSYNLEPKFPTPSTTT